MKRLSTLACVAAAAGLVLLACGDVPTLADGIAYITRIERPSTSIEVGDQLRDSLGMVARLRVRAFDSDNKPVPNVTPVYVVTSAPRGFTIAADGAVSAAGDTLGTAIFVARVSERLQTIAETLFVVQPADSIAASARVDTISATNGSSLLQVTVSGVFRGTRSPVRGIVVRYRIDSILPSRPVDSTKFVFTEPEPGHPTRAVDTTDASGIASRTLGVVLSPGITAIAVTATATSLRGHPLRGGPVRFLVPVK